MGANHTAGRASSASFQISVRWLSLGAIDQMTTVLSTTAITQ